MSDAHPELFVRGMGGSYRRPADMALNPFDVEDTSTNRQFLLYWILLLLGDVSTYGESERSILKGGVDHLFTLAPKTRSLSALIAHVQPQHADMASRLSVWEEKGWFTGDAPNLISGDVVAFDLGDLRAESASIGIAPRRCYYRKSGRHLMADQQLLSCMIRGRC